MKKVCFVTLGNIYLAPYLEAYTRLIEDSDYSIICWDREGISNYYKGCNNIYSFNKVIQSSISKLFGYFEFRRYALRVLKDNHYDIVIFLQTSGALLFRRYICKHLKKRYIVDIRDYSGENCKLVYQLEKKVIKNSLKCVISSEGYLKFLPEGDFLVVHNMRLLNRGDVERIANRSKKKEVINIAFIGFVNYQEQHKKLLMALKNDDRFLISFIGSKADELSAFCEQNEIKNVKLIGRFESSKIINFYYDVDLINNLYGNHTPVLDYALSNKLYFAAELNIPILTCSDTFMSEISHKFGFGFDVDVSDQNCGDKIWDYYNSIDWPTLRTNCGQFMKKVHEEQQVFEETIANFLR